MSTAESPEKQSVLKKRQSETQGPDLVKKQRKVVDSESSSNDGSDSSGSHNTIDGSQEDHDKQKWSTLEHHGITFPPAYQALPSNIKLKNKETGEELTLLPEVEEMATWWAHVENTDFGLKEKVVKNFEGEFLPNIDAKYGIKQMAQLDFSAIKAHLDQVKEDKNNRPTEIKKKEAEDRQKASAPYQYCVIDQEVEKVGTAVIEPPGIFRGRGEHPHIGKMKSRIVPEQVTINVGADDPIPPCPIAGHAWKQIVSNHQATWLCHFKDDQSFAKSSGKYLFLGAESKLKRLNDKEKYERARRLKALITDVRKKYTQYMEDSDDLKNQIGVAIYLIDHLALRVGNEKNEDEADTVGCCSLRVEHISLEDGENKVTFDFLGKDSMRYHNTVEVTPLVYKLMRRFMKKNINGTPKDPRDDLFDKINAGILNDHLKEHMNDLSAKVFRTYNASITLQKQLSCKAEEEKVTESSTIDQKVNFYNQCNRDVAILCNHKKAESKNIGEQLAKISQKIADLQKELKQLGTWKAALKKAKTAIPKNPNNLPKTVEACESKIKKLKEQIQKKEQELQTKNDNKEVALGTSKINYMDPRITISWCKRTETPIEKVFPKTLCNKFAWAMDNEPQWIF